jgi:hypothetical protein
VPVHEAVSHAAWCWSANKRLGRQIRQRNAAPTRRNEMTSSKSSLVFHQRTTEQPQILPAPLPTSSSTAPFAYTPVSPRSSPREKLELRESTPLLSDPPVISTCTGQGPRISSTASRDSPPEGPALRHGTPAQRRQVPASRQQHQWQDSPTQRQHV